MWLSSVLLVLVVAGRAMADPEPGLLRVPKVYNAVITSNQNLAPSRAYPVIQPVVHRTAIGYVPPFYYTQLGPGFVGPEVVPLDPGVIGGRGGGGGGREGERREGGRREGVPSRPEEVESVERTDEASGPNSPPPKKIGRPISGSRDVESSGELSSAENTEQTQDGDKGKKGKNDRVPLSFYPNYQSLYYDPYFYPYGAFPPHLAAPGTYYVDYPQPPGLLGPLGPPPPIGPIGPPGYPVPGARPDTTNGREPGQDSGRESGRDDSRRSEKQRIRSNERRDKIPDVPPPPLPTTMRKKNS